MGKITISLTDETEQKLLEYVKSKHSEPMVDIVSGVVEESVKEYLKKHDESIHSDRVFY